MKKYLVPTDVTFSRPCASTFRAATGDPAQGRGVPIAGRLFRERGSASTDLTWTTVV